MISKIIILGPANAKKTEIILSVLLDNPIISARELVFVCESENGCAVDYARKHNITLFVTDDKKFKTTTSIEMLKLIKADLLISCAWNVKIPMHLSALFEYPILNCHGSLLPDYKGHRAYLHQWANIEEEYGATIHEITDKFDEGVIIVQGKLKLYLRENLVIIHRRISEITGYLIPQAIIILESGLLKTKPLTNEKARFFYKTPKWKLNLHRLINRFSVYFNSKRWLTSHKIMNK